MGKKNTRSKKKLNLSLFLSAVLSAASAMASTDANDEPKNSEARLTASQGRCKAGVIADCTIYIGIGTNNFFTITNSSPITAFGVTAQFPSGDNWDLVIQSPTVANIKPGESLIFSYTTLPGPTPTNGSIIPIKGSNTGNSTIYVKFCFGIACP